MNMQVLSREIQSFITIQLSLPKCVFFSNTGLRNCPKQTASLIDIRPSQSDGGLH